MHVGGRTPAASRPHCPPCRWTRIGQIAVHSQGSATAAAAVTAAAAAAGAVGIIRCSAGALLFFLSPGFFFLNGRGRFSRRPPLTHFTRSVRVSAFTFSPSVLLLSRQDAAAGGNGCYLERVLFVPEPSNEGKERTDYHQPEKCLLLKSFLVSDSSNTCHVLFSPDKNSEKKEKKFQPPPGGQYVSARGETGG